MSGIILVPSCDHMISKTKDKLVAGSICAQGDGAVNLKTEVNLTAKVHARDADLSVSPTEAWRPKAASQAEGLIPTFYKFDNKLAYYVGLVTWQENLRRLGKQHQKVHSKATPLRSELLEALAKPLPTKPLVVPMEPMQRATIMPQEYSCHQAQVLAELICKAKNIFEVDKLRYPMERNWTLFTMQYLKGKAATSWR